MILLEVTEASGCAVQEAGAAANELLIKVIQPGWGSSGYYSKQVLERDGALRFPDGTKMYVNHPTLKENAERPEGDLTKMAAVFTEAARWVEDGPRGAGLYAKAKVFSDHANFIAERAAHMGVSIRASATGRPGEAEGRKGTIIERLVCGKSVDFVAEAGAGGEVIIQESERKAQDMELELKLSEALSREAELKASVVLREAKVAELEQRLVVSEASAVLAETLAKSPHKLPRAAQARVAASATAGVLPVVEGRLDVKAFEVRINEALAAEAQYIADLKLSVGEGVSRVGVNTQEQATTEVLESAFKRLNIQPEIAVWAAKGRI